MYRNMFSTFTENSCIVKGKFMSKQFNIVYETITNKNFTRSGRQTLNFQETKVH